MSEELQPPDQRMLRLHLESGRFRAGVVAGRWRLVSLEWPHVVIGVNARDGVEYGFRFPLHRLSAHGGYGSTVGYREQYSFAAREVADRSRPILIGVQSGLETEARASICRATVNRSKGMRIGGTSIPRCCGTRKKGSANISGSSTSC